MNNTKTVSAIVAVLIAAALVVGGTSAAMTTGHSAFAWKQDSYKKKGDNKSTRKMDKMVTRNKDKIPTRKILT